jgi:putative phosphoesterase
MKLAIISDIHDNVWMLTAALKGVQDADALICCGDLCSPFIVNQLAEGFRDRPIHIVFGNNDGDLFRITHNAGKYAHVHLHGVFFQGALGGKRLAVNHYNDIALAIAKSGAYALVCYGHNHAYKIESIGNTLTINPGAIMGYDPINKKDVPSTFVIYDTDTGQTMSYQVTPAFGSGVDVAKVIPYP